jgi:cytoskeleton protein RodZ
LAGGISLSNEIGYRLRQARELLRLSLEDVEATTRIQKKYLIALEQGDFSQFPSPAYVRAYVRAYALAVGENPQQLLQLYQPGPQPPAGARSMNQRSPQQPVAGGQQLRQGNTRMTPTPSAHPNRMEQAKSLRQMTEESAELVEQPALVRTAKGKPRRPQMPADVPDPEELGITPSPPEPVPGPRRQASQPLQPRRRDARREKKKQGSVFGKVYTIMLIVGAVLLVLATIAFMWYRAENAAQLKSKEAPLTVKQNQVKEADKPLGKPRLSVLSTSPEGPDRYELINAHELELKISWLRESGSAFEVRKQEIDKPFVQGEVNEDKKVFTQSFSTGVWLKLLEPKNVSVNINGFPVGINKYSSEKDIYISVVK